MAERAGSTPTAPVIRPWTRLPKRKPKVGSTCMQMFCYAVATQFLTRDGRSRVVCEEHAALLTAKTQRLPERRR